MLTSWRIIWHKKIRFILSSAGVSMACIIMFLEQGFFNGVIDSQSNITHLIQGELVVFHRARTHLNKWNSYKDIHSFQIRGLDAIDSVIPVYKTTMGLRNSDTDQIKSIIVYAFPADTIPIDFGASPEVMSKIKLPRVVLFDRKSRDIYGEIGNDIELDGNIFDVADYINMGPNIIHDGIVVMSQGQLLTTKPGQNPVMAVIKLKQPGNVDSVKRFIEQNYEKLTVMTPEELAAREIKFMSTAAPVGIIFGIGMLAGFVIGVIICYQILFNEITDLLPQYATLKAMGFSKIYLGRLIVEQAFFLALAGYFLSLPIIIFLYKKISEATLLPIYLMWEHAVFLLLLTMLMCVFAGFIAMRKVWHADPAELF